MLDMKALIAKLLSTPMVIEQGTDANGWTYRKWSDGTFDAEKEWNIGQYTINTTEASPIKVGGDLTITMPAAMISGSVVASVQGNTQNSPVFLEHYAATKVRIAKVTTSNITIQGMYLYLKTVNGRWK